MSQKLGDKVGEFYKFNNAADWNQMAGTWGGKAYNAYYGLAPSLLEEWMKTIEFR